MYKAFGISEEVYNFCENINKELSERFSLLDKTCEYNQLKVIKAMQDAKVSEASFNETTGYGYNDIGRDDIEKTYANVFHTEDALVRPQITCGTHALSTALWSCLRPGDELLYITGKPYDTLEEVIGIRESIGSLKEFGISFDKVDLLDDGSFDYEGIKSKIKNNTKVIGIQRSKGYQSRKSLSAEEIGEVISYVKSINNNLIVMVDNCYGEFVCEKEPSDFGADMTVGSLIKNPGGGLAKVGGYIAGTKECIDKCAYRLTSPGLGKEVGPTLGTSRDVLQGLFLAPSVVNSALKSAIFAANIYERLGFKTVPDSTEPRYDIIQSIEFCKEEILIAFCQSIQSASPVDSYVVPEPYAMPGYNHDVIMAAGAFVSGSSIELSSDAPIKEPYTAFFQGSLTYAHGKFGIIKTVDTLYKKGFIKI